MFLCDKETRQHLEALADGEGRSLSNLIERLVLSALKSRRSRSEKTSDAETLELLIGFLNYLLDHHDHDGYSLAEIGAILGRETGDKDLIALIAKLQNGNAKTGVKPR